MKASPERNLTPCLSLIIWRRGKYFRGGDTVSSFEAEEARDGCALQWAMSEMASFRAAGSSGSGSIHVPGWPDGSNMDHKIIVAVMDQAVDFSNPDLADRAYTFSADLMETLGCDRYGYNALPDSFPAEEQGGRGTPAAGMIGASWDGRGISGVASNVEIVSVQNVDPEGRCSLANTLRGMNFIKEARMSGVGIRIVNNSWAVRRTSKALSAAVTELGRLGIINIFSAGDESRDLNPCTSIAGSLADNPYAVIAASTDPSGNLADSSSYGSEIVTLGAPGVSILSTIKTQSAAYLPALASQNKYYEDFESGEPSLRIFQVDFETGEEIAGTEGEVVSGEEVPGFEGRCVYKVKTDPSGFGGRDDGTALLEMDLGDVSDIISGGDSLGFAYGGHSAPFIEALVDTASGDAPFIPLNASGKADCMNSFVYTLPEGVDTDHLSFRLAVRPGSDHEICFDTIGIGEETQPYKFLSGSLMAASAVSGAAAVLASRYYEELQALNDASSAEMLASLVRSSVRPLSSLAETTGTGGILDLSAEPSIPEIMNHLSTDQQYTLVGDSEALEEKAQNGIPLVVIRIDEQELHQSKKGNWYGTIADMNNSPDHSVRCNGSVEILLPEEGYVSEYGGSVPSGSITLDYIRGRGNSTWVSQQKKPYKLQLQEKSALFGMGESKSWALMANVTDPSLVKNRITSYLGDAMGFSWSPRMVPVDVVMIGSESGRDYLGSYFLSELVGIEDSRLDIDALNKNVASMEGDPNITGGHLLSVYNLYQDSDQPESNYFTLHSGISFTHEDPSFETEDELTDGQIAQREYIRSYMQQVDSLIMDGDTIDEAVHDELASLLDLKSVADYWLIQEFSSNVDSFGTSSTFLNKARNGKLMMGPLWDFDLAWGDPSTDLWYEYTTVGFNTTKAFWLDELRLKDPLFVELLKQEWPLLRAHLEELICEGGAIDQYQQELSRSRQANIERWPDLAKLDDYGTLMSNLKKWISMRIAWFDEHLDEISKSLVKISFEADGNLIESMYVRNGTYLSKGPEEPYKEGYVFIGWFEKNTHKGVKNYQAEQDTVFAADYLTEKEAIAPEALYFSDYEVWVLLGDTFDADFQSCVFPENTSNKAIRWSSSNTDIISVNADGSIEGNAIGEAVLTGTLYNGISNSLTVHVYNRSDNVIMPDGLKLVPEDMELTLGETKELRVISTPEGILRRHMFLSLMLEDSSVAELKYGAGNDRVFLLTGLKEGETKLSIEAERDESKYTAVCNVKVVNDRTSPGEEDSPTDPEKGPETTPETTNPGTDPTTVPVIAEDGTAFEKGADAAALDKAIAESVSESDPEGSEFSLLRLRTKKETRSSIKVIWQRADGAKKYVVYAGACGKKNALKKVKTTTSRSYTMKKWNGKKLQKGKYYKIMVAALDENNKVISVSKLVHAATKGGKAGNAKSVSTTSKANQKVKKLTLKVGKTFKLKAKAVAESKKQKISAHRSIQFESSNPGIAAVSKKGWIRAVSKGVCYVYAYAQNGRYSRVKVSVAAK